MISWIFTRKHVKELTRRIDTLVSVTTKYLKEIAELKGELRRQRVFFNTQIAKRDTEYRDLMLMVMKQRVYTQATQILPTPSAATSKQPLSDMLSLFEELPLGHEDGYAAEDLGVFGYNEVAEVKEAGNE